MVLLTLKKEIEPPASASKVRFFVWSDLFSREYIKLLFLRKCHPNKKRAVKLLPFQIYLYQNFHLDDVVSFITSKNHCFFSTFLPLTI